MASFGSIVDCGSKPGGFSRMTFDVMQWIRKVKVNKKFLAAEGASLEATIWVSGSKEISVPVMHF